MKSLDLYEPAMCCSTGVCGPSPNPELVRVGSDLERLAKTGVKVSRYNLSQQPEAFVLQSEVQQLLVKEGLFALPVVLVDGKVSLFGRYPTTAEFAAWATETGKEGASK